MYILKYVGEGTLNKTSIPLRAGGHKPAMGHDCFRPQPDTLAPKFKAWVLQAEAQAPHNCVRGPSARGDAQHIINGRATMNDTLDAREVLKKCGARSRQDGSVSHPNRGRDGPRQHEQVASRTRKKNQAHLGPSECSSTHFWESWLHHYLQWGNHANPQSSENEGSMQSP